MKSARSQGALLDSCLQRDQKTSPLEQWSPQTLHTFCKAGNKDAYLLDVAGDWADCIRQGRPVIHNDYGFVENGKGIKEEGHPTVVRDLVVPVKREGMVVAVVASGDKHLDYTEKDRRNGGLPCRRYVGDHQAQAR